jgi:hypothetical protein
MNADDPGVLAAEVSGGLATAALILVFIPFFFEGMRRSREKLTKDEIAWTRRLLKSLPVAVSAGAATSTAGLVTLWGQQDLAVLTAALSIITIWIVVLLAALAVFFQVTIWNR